MTQVEDGIAAQRALCERARRAPGPWAVLARLLLTAGRAAEALAAAEMALAQEPRHMAARAARKAAVEALEASDPVLAALELTAALNPDDARAHLELGHACADLDRPADAERHLKQALALDPDLTEARARLAALYLGVGIEDGAEHHSRLVLTSEPGQAVASQTLAAILERRGEHAGAQKLLDEAYGRQSLFVEPARDSRLTVLVMATQTGGNIPYRHLMPPNRYTRLVWYMEHAQDGQIAGLPAHDVVFNAIGDADVAEACEAPVRRFLAARPRPVLNDPDKVSLTRRHLIPALLGGLDGVAVPAAARLEAGAVAGSSLAEAAARAGLAPPLLVRPIGSHGGRGLSLAETPEVLAELGTAFEGEDLYLTQYCDYRSSDGRFRKGRMIFVDRRPYPYHWAVAEDWMVHYDNAGMGGDAARQAEERRFLSDPRGFLGPGAYAAIEAIGRRLDLDYCGLDFSLLPDGRVLVFEANATMLAHPESPDGEFAYKNPAVQAIVEAFQARLGALASALSGL